MCGKVTNVAGQYQYPHVRLRELEQSIDHDSEPHTMYSPPYTPTEANPEQETN
jgi:hypothetical protein